MSYYEAPDYYKNPVPYTESDIGAPVPGWGVNPKIAGPTMVGIGQDLFLKKAPVAPKMIRIQSQEPKISTSEPFPWWVWPIGAAALMGGFGYLGVKQGWL